MSSTKNKNYIILIDEMRTSDDPGPGMERICYEEVPPDEFEDYYNLVYISGYVTVAIIYNNPHSGYVIRYVELEEYVRKDPCEDDEDNIEYTGEFRAVRVYKSEIPYNEVAEMFAYDTPQIFYTGKLTEINAEELLRDKELREVLEKLGLLGLVTAERIDNLSASLSKDPESYAMDWLEAYDCDVEVVRDGEVISYSDICRMSDDEKAKALKALGEELFGG